ncbi:response regulator transcription factor [Mesorhizobium erdmanii]|uniref:response regulator transcription factor n=1 Tax=Mesorhizobium erdmanii TaxID=1777866 RepID=UPI00041BC123|nr:LuxR C-terminal-related transcriptional regulator [Mesorhizobium erdmanii]
MHMNVSTPNDHCVSEKAVVFVLDDDISVRESLDSLVRSVGWLPKTFETAAAFLYHPKALVPSCLILDFNLPDLNGLDLLTLISVERAEMPIIFITGHADIPLAVKAMRAGALEFLTKPFSGEVLVRAIELALQRSKDVLRFAAKIQAMRDCCESLSRREREVMALVVGGLMNKQIAFQLGISEITVKAHRGQVMRKMKAKSLPELVKMAAILGKGHHTTSPQSALP